MRLIDLTEDLHHVLDELKSDAASLASGDRPYVGKIELTPDWEDEIPRLIHRYEKQRNRTFNSFDDPDGKDEDKWMDAHFQMTKDFLIQHNLATEVQSDEVDQ